MKRNGFTLIELLAVIVILAIIALIAVPIVLNIINNSKEQANMRSAEIYLVAAKQGLVAHLMKNPNDVITTCDVSDTGNLNCGENIEIPVKIDGEKIMPETITFGVKGNIEEVTGLMINGKKYTYLNGRLKESTTDPEVPEEPEKTSTIVYRWSTDTISIGDTINPIDYTMDPSTLGKNFYLKHVLDKDNIVIESYSCVKYNNKEYCVRGGNGDYYGYAENVADYTGNALVLKKIQDEGFNCYFYEYSSYCSADSIDLSANADDSVNGYDANDYCSVYYDGSSYCASWNWGEGE